MTTDDRTKRREPSAWTGGRWVAVVLVAFAAQLLPEMLSAPGLVLLYSIACVLAAGSIGWHVGRAEGIEGDMAAGWRGATPRAKVVGLSLIGPLLIAPPTYVGFVFGVAQAIATAVFVVVLLAVSMFPSVPESVAEEVREARQAVIRSAAGGLVVVLAMGWLVPWPTGEFGQDELLILCLTAFVVSGFGGFLSSRLVDSGGFNIIRRRSSV